jgi:peptide chain release factor 3
VETVLEPLPYECSAWLLGERATFGVPVRSTVVRDVRGRSLVLFPSEWDRRQAEKKNPGHRLVDVA